MEKKIRELKTEEIQAAAGGRRAYASAVSSETWVAPTATTFAVRPSAPLGASKELR